MSLDLQSRTRALFAGGLMVWVGACGPGSQSEGGADEAGDPCADAQDGWTTARTGYPQLTALWSDGERALAYGGGAMLVYEAGQEPDLREGLVELSQVQIEARAVDDAWVLGVHYDPDSGVAFSRVYHWDGVALSSTMDNLDSAQVAVADDGEVWMVDRVTCGLADCPTSIWRWQDGGWTMEEGPPAEVQNGQSLWAGSGGELWVGAAGGGFAHRSPGGAWTTEVYGDPGFAAQALTVDGSGALWAAASGASLSLVRRSPEGEWTGATASEMTYALDLVATTGGLSVAAKSGVDKWIFLDWDGTSPPQEGLEAAALGLESVYGASGTEASRMLLSKGPSLHVVDAGAAAPEAESLVDYETALVTGGGAASMDGVFEYEGPSVRRWQGGAWADVLTLADIAGQPPTIRALYPDSPDRGWLLMDPDPDAGTNVYKLWRFDDGEAEAWSWQPPEIQHRRLSGSGPDNVWLVSRDGESGRAWRYDGADWTSVLGESDGLGEIMTLSFDGDSALIVTREAQVLRFTEGDWVAVGEPLLGEIPIQGPSLARVGDELLVVYSYDVGWDFPETEEASRRFDGESWVEVSASLPDFWQLRGDGEGRAWALTADPLELYRHDGSAPADQGWEPVELELGSPVNFHAAPDGVLIHDLNTTSVFRWACE